MKSIAIAATLVALAKGEEKCPDAGEVSSLLQLQTAQLERRTNTQAASTLLQTAHAITEKVKSGDDPNGCFESISSAREAVEAGLAAIPQQFQHLANQIQIAGDNMQACASREVDGSAMVTQQGTDLATARATHETCRTTQESLEAGIAPCQQLATLRNSLGNQQCFSLPVGEDEGEAWVAALEAAITTLQGHLSMGRPLLNSCNEAEEALARQQTECANAQRQFEEDYCAHRASCTSLQICRAAAEENYLLVQAEVQAALASLHEEFQVMTRTGCILEANVNALAQDTSPSTGSCDGPASTDHLTIEYPTLDPLTTCDSTILTNSPCNAGFVAAEYQQFAQSEAILEACTQCSAIPIAGAPQSWLTHVGVVDLNNLQPGEGSPAGCTCTPVQLQGEYSAGPVVRCDNCIDTYRSTDANSCPSGFKIFSPRSQQDWDTLHSSVALNDLKSPYLIADITRPANGCGGCSQHTMNSDTEAQSSWVTSDGSPWFLRSSTYHEPNGDYTENCYMEIRSFVNGEVTFNDYNCLYHSNKYLCQIYQNGVGSSITPPAPPPAGSGPYGHLGCYQSYVWNANLGSVHYSGHRMTVPADQRLATCNQECRSAGYDQFGIEHVTACICGNAAQLVMPRAEGCANGFGTAHRTDVYTVQ